MRVGLISEGSQDNKFPSFPVSHPSLFGVFQIFFSSSISTLQIRIDPSSLEADANLVYLPSDGGRKTTDLTVDGTFALKKGSPVDVSHTQIVLSRDPETKYVSSGEKQTEVTELSCTLINSRTRLPLSAFKSRIVPSSDPDIRYEPS